MDELRKADAEGWTNWKAVSENADLKPLRERDDFKALIRTKTGSPPPAAGAK